MRRMILSAVLAGGVCLLAVAATISGAALAQAQGPAIAPTPIKLERYDGFKEGRLAVYTGAVSTEPHVFTLDDLTILAPVMMTLRGERGTPLKIKVSKYAEEPLREVALDADGRADVRFRTQGGFYARVSSTSEEPVPYTLLVAVGDEVKPELPSVYASYEEAAKRSNGMSGDAGGVGGNLVLWLIAGALMAIVVLLALLVQKRSRP
jgi:hypothetical protein